MSKTQDTKHDSFTLPASIVSKVDVSRLVDEVERVNNDMTAAGVRKGKHHEHSKDEQSMAMPTLSDQLASFLKENEFELENSNDRAHIIKELRLLKNKVPVVNLTFAVTADRESLQQLVAWFRSEAHPQTVLSVSLQPALIAGVYVRTPNQIHDMSMRTKLKAGRTVLLKELEAFRGNK